jgi:abhydrolase domain-containing protein 13
MGHRLPIARMFYENFKANVFIFSYRGYGKSDLDWTSESGIKIDAQTALEYLRTLDSIDKSKIVAFGQSIGAAVAIDLVAKNEGLFKALIVENTFLSIPKLIPHVMPALNRVSFLCTEIWNSEERIKGIERLPVLFLGSEKDELVPPAHFKQLYGTISSKDKKFAGIPKATHNDAPFYKEYWDSVSKFWSEKVTK